MIDPHRLDAHWVVTSLMQVVWGYALLVDPLVEDTEAAVDAEQWATAVECATEGLLRVAYCRAALAGYAGPRGELDLLGEVVGTGYLADAAQMPRPFGSDEGTATESLGRLHVAVEEFKDEVPIELPRIRTPDGFYPALRLARDLSALRERLGLEPFPWDWSYF